MCFSVVIIIKKKCSDFWLVYSGTSTSKGTWSIAAFSNSRIGNCGIRTLKKNISWWSYNNQITSKIDGTVLESWVSGSAVQIPLLGWHLLHGRCTLKWWWSQQLKNEVPWKIKFFFQVIGAEGLCLWQRAMIQLFYLSIMSLHFADQKNLFQPHGWHLAPSSSSFFPWSYTIFMGIFASMFMR